MIINSEVKLKVGAIHGQEGKISDLEYNWHKVSFFVLREATKEEYIGYIHLQGATVNLAVLYPFYYEVSMD